MEFRILGPARASATARGVYRSPSSDLDPMDQSGDRGGRTTDAAQRPAMTVTLRSQASLEMAAAKEAVVRRLIDALQRADVAAIGELVSDDVVYHFPGESPVAGTYRGREEVVELFSAFRRLLDGPPRMSSHDVVASEAHVVELTTLAAERGGRPHEWNAVRIYHVVEVDITEIWLMIDDLSAFDAWLAATSRDVTMK